MKKSVWVKIIIAIITFIVLVLAVSLLFASRFSMIPGDNGIYEQYEESMIDE